MDESEALPGAKDHFRDSAAEGAERGKAGMKRKGLRLDPEPHAPFRERVSAMAQPSCCEVCSRSTRQPRPCTRPLDTGPVSACAETVQLSQGELCGQSSRGYPAGSSA